MGERLNGIQEVRSSILLISTKVAYRATFFMPVLRNFDIERRLCNEVLFSICYNSF